MTGKPSSMKPPPPPTSFKPTTPPKSPNLANPSPPDSPKPTKELVIHVNSFDDLEEEEEEDNRSSLHLEDGDEYDSDTSSRISTSSSHMESSVGSSSYLSASNGGIQDSRMVSIRVQKKSRKLYESAREVMTSEQSFVGVLRLICVDFKTFVESLQQFSVIPQQEFSVFFKDLTQMLAFNEILLQDFENRITNWDKEPKIADVFIKKGPFLKIHKTYIDNFENLSSHLIKCCKDFPKFKKALEEFESLPQCKHLKLSFHLVTAAKRVMQYKMMLENYMKYLPEDSGDFDDTTEAIRIVSHVADHCNKELFGGVSFESLSKGQEYFPNVSGQV